MARPTRLQPTTQFGHTGENLTSRTDPLKAVQRRFVDAAGRLISVTDPLGHQTRGHELMSIRRGGERPRVNGWAVMITGSPSRVWGFVAKSLIAVSLAVGLGSTWLWYDYADTRSRVATPLEGRVYGLNTHGTVVYLTRPEKLCLEGLETIAGLCMLSSFVIYWRISRRAGTDRAGWIASGVKSTAGNPNPPAQRDCNNRT